MIKIHMFQAGSGDSFLVQIEPDTDKEVNLLIDCGYNYRQGIKPKLEELISKQGKKIDRFIITHYDADHIQGALALIKDNGKADAPKLFPIEQVWLNTFRHLQLNKFNDELSNKEKRKVEAYCSSCKLKSTNVEGEIGALQATTLGALLYKNEYIWNKDSQGKAISINNIQSIELNEKTSLQLLSPTNDILKLLEENFITDLARVGLEAKGNELFDDAFEYFTQKEEEIENYKIKEGMISSGELLIDKEFIVGCDTNAKYVRDTSNANNSSIAFILENENNRILFIGDAHGEEIIKALNEIKKEGEEFPLYFDVIKVSHHGSYCNNSSELYRYIDSEKFIISTNGKHPKHTHPDAETIACIINRPLHPKIENGKRDLFFNYELKHLEGFHNSCLQNKFRYSIKTVEEINI